MNDYLAVLLFFLPAAIGNTTPVFANKVPIINKWDTPIDMEKRWRGKRVLGDNKRWRGIVFGTLMGGFSSVLFSLFNTHEFTHLHPFFLGCILGFGALFGDVVESFVKRQRGTKPGQLWFPFDQLDYIFGALIFILPFVSFSISEILTIVVFFFGLHIVSTYIGYLLKLRDAPI